MMAKRLGYEFNPVYAKERAAFEKQNQFWLRWCWCLAVVSYLTGIFTGILFHLFA